jgi:hypothetical protein
MNTIRNKHCSDAVVKEWEHIILTANLVADEKLQKEYLDYHATQFEKWPESSKRLSAMQIFSNCCCSEMEDS